MKPEFIVELKKLRKKPCGDYLQHFVDGKADALELFRLEGGQYDWLYNHSNYDLISYEIEQGIFDWEEYSWAVAQYRPQHFDSDKYNWERCSWYVARYCPQHFDPEKYNWEKYSYFVAQFCPQYLDAEKYNWEKHESYVREYCPHLLHLKPQTA